jgi:hypothetical protein
MLAWTVMMLVPVEPVLLVIDILGTLIPFPSVGSSAATALENKGQQQQYYNACEFIVHPKK